MLAVRAHVTRTLSARTLSMDTCAPVSQDSWEMAPCVQVELSVFIHTHTASLKMMSIDFVFLASASSSPDLPFSQYSHVADLGWFFGGFFFFCIFCFFISA